MATASHSDFDELMPHRIVVFKAQGYDTYGSTEHYAVPVTYKCLFDDTFSITRSQEGETLTVGRTAYINTDGNAIDELDKLQFVDGTTRPVISISNHYDANGDIHNVTVQFT